MSASEKRGSQGRSTYDLLSWSNGPDSQSAVKTPVRVSATNNSQGFTSANDPSCELPSSRSAIRILQPSGVSQISFGEGDNSFHKRANSLAEVAKQKELVGTREIFEEQPRRPMSNAKAKEMCGSNIFGPPTSEHQSGSHNQKAAEMSGNGIFKKEAYGVHVERNLSDAKRKEMVGSDIFCEDKTTPAQNFVSTRAARKPPDALVKIKQLNGSNPVQHDENASPQIPDLCAQISTSPRPKSRK